MHPVGTHDTRRITRSVMPTMLSRKRLPFWSCFMQRYWLFAAVVALAFAPALVWAGDPPKAKDVGKAYSIPYRLTDSGHIMVRVKINGKGPFNFIVDTGAPLVYVTLPVAKKL